MIVEEGKESGHGGEKEVKGEMERKGSNEQTKMEPCISAEGRGVRQPIIEDRHIFFCKAIFHPPIQ